MNIIFVAVPYTGTIEEKIIRYNLAATYIVSLINEGKHAYSPVVFGHPLSQLTGLSGEFAFWKEHCFGFIDICSEVHVLTVPGWNKSEGVIAEIEYAVATGKSITIIDPKVSRGV